MNILVAQTVFRPVLHKPFTCIDHEHSFSVACIFLVNHNQAGRNTGAVKQVGRQTNDAFNVSFANQVLAYLRFGISTKQDSMGEDNRCLALTFQRADHVQQEGIVAIFIRRNAKAIETAISISRFRRNIQSVAPVLGRERRIGNDVIEQLQPVAFQELRVGEGAVSSASDQRVGTIVQYNVHTGQTGSGTFLFLSVDGNFPFGFVGYFQQQRSRSAGRIINGGVGGRILIVDANDLGHDAAHLCRRVKLPLALTAFGGKVAHQVFVSIPQDIVTFGFVVGKVQFRLFKDGYQVRKTFHLFITRPQLLRIIEIHLDGTQRFVGLLNGSNDLFIDVIANGRFSL